jgi:hypothetical protein
MGISELVVNIIYMLDFDGVNICCYIYVSWVCKLVYMRVCDFVTVWTCMWIITICELLVLSCVCDFRIRAAADTYY